MTDINKLFTAPEKLFQVEDFKDRSLWERAIFFRKVAKDNFDVGMMGFKARPVKEWGGFNDGYYTQALILFQQSFELYFKSLLCLRDIDIYDKKMKLRNHDLCKLLDHLMAYYPELQEIKENKSVYYLLDELGKKFDTIRYGEGALLFRHCGQSHLLELESMIYFVKEKLERLIKFEFEKRDK